MIGIEIERQDQFRKQSTPNISQPEGQEIGTEYKSVVSLRFVVWCPHVPLFPQVPSFNQTDSASQKLR